MIHAHMHTFKLPSIFKFVIQHMITIISVVNNICDKNTATLLGTILLSVSFDCVSTAVLNLPTYS